MTCPAIHLYWCSYIQDEYTTSYRGTSGGDAALYCLQQGSLVCTDIPTPKAIRAARPVKKHQASKATNHPITTAQHAIAQNVKHGSLHKRPRTITVATCNACNYVPRFCTVPLMQAPSIEVYQGYNRTASVPRLSLQWSSRDRQRYWRLCCV